MKGANVRAACEITTTITLTMEEALALDGVLGYNVDAFLKVFYEKMGAAYVRPYEAGVRSLHTRLRSELIPALHKVKAAHAILAAAVREANNLTPATDSRKEQTKP